MVEVTKTSANWRLFGGGGLLVAGILWIVAIVLGQNGIGTVAAWLAVVALFIIAIAHLFLAFGQTGSNGIVGALAWGKIALLAAAAGWLLWAVASLLAILEIATGDVVAWVSAVLIVVGGLLAAVAIFGRGVARGIAKWALFVPVLWSVFLMLVIIVPIALDNGWWVALVLAVLYGLTGIAYLFNKADLPAMKS